ncbi:MAG: class I SAM-dependent methyltransferase [Planctomycetota bacterium]
MPTYEPFDWYQTPVYYDIIFDADTEKEATFLEQVAARHVQPETPRPLTILEPACGSGRLMAELAARGHTVAGCDLAGPMLDFARKRFKERGVKGHLAKAPMQQFDLHRHTQQHGGYDLAHILVSSFKYLLTDDDAALSLRCICDHLRPGGVFVLGIHLSEYGQDETTLERWRASRGNTDVICTIKSWPPDPETRLEKVRSRIVAHDLDRHTDEPKRYESNWDFRTYDEAELLALLAVEPRLRHCATHTFHHEISEETALGSEDLGLVLVLRREA